MGNNLQKKSVREAANMDVSSGYVERPRLTISSARHVAFGLSPRYRDRYGHIHVYSDSDVYWKWALLNPVRPITSVKVGGATSPSTGNPCFHCAAGHGYAAGDYVLIAGTGVDTYNVMASASNVTASSFYVEAIGGGACYASFSATASGYSASVTDVISTTNSQIWPALTPITPRIPWGLESAASEGAQDSMIAIHFKQVNSAATKYLRISEA